MREEGYYWVKLDMDKGLWCVAFYDAMNNEWDIPGLIPTRHDDDFLEIDENRIVRLPKAEIDTAYDGDLKC